VAKCSLTFWCVPAYLPDKLFQTLSHDCEKLLEHRTEAEQEFSNLPNMETVRNRKTPA
jgi:hypothetical protein